MYNSGRLEVSYESIIDVVKSKENEMTSLSMRMSELSLENIVSDMQFCTFLARDAKGNFRFTHKSFMEYFVARLIKQ